ncbi:LADA_0G15566g1_1 [Lachancea dasiensis]|uniref:LADA_0G15566g1_1 n=1 Tax=Lachancea dasiensis TaxID=1072105 RepID=A0A1G4JWH6_9SACH|nr:LADA_0G15566g1_1 [Lachancea dasiensis]
MDTASQTNDSDSVTDSSNYVSAASSIEALDAQHNRDQDFVGDSQDSDVASLSGRNELFRDNASLSESSEEGSTDSFNPLADLGISDSAAPELKPSRPARIDFVEFHKGHRFDDELLPRLQKFEEVSKTTDSLSQQPKRVNDQNSLRELQSKLAHKVPRAYLEMVLRENNYHQYEDWHFMTEDSQGKDCDPWEQFLNPHGHLPQPSLKEFLVSIGVPTSFMPETAEKISVTMFDRMNYLESVSWMCQQLEHYVDSSGFTKTFIRYILDRNIYDSAECNSMWCSKVYGQLCEDHFLRTYLQLVENDEYMLHLRVARQIPEIHGPLLEALHPNAGQQVFAEKFHELLNSKEYRKLLYFILFILGTDKLPFGRNDITLHFKNQIHDFCEDGNNLELIVLKSYINLFLNR